jgi:hypothetical protein
MTNPPRKEPRGEQGDQQPMPADSSHEQKVSNEDASQKNRESHGAFGRMKARTNFFARWFIAGLSFVLLAIPIATSASYGQIDSIRDFVEWLIPRKYSRGYYGGDAPSYMLLAIPLAIAWLILWLKRGKAN